MTRNNLSLQTNEGWYLVAGFAIAIVAAAVVALASYSDINQYYNRVDWVTHTDVVLRTLDGARGDTFGSVAALQTYYQSGDRKKPGPTRAKCFRTPAYRRGAPRPHRGQRVPAAPPRSGRPVRAARGDPHARRYSESASTIRREDALSMPIFVELAAALYQLRARFDPMSVAEQALLTERAANARATLHRSAMVMGIGGTVIFTWLLLVGGYAGLTTNRLKQTAVDRKKAEDSFARCSKPRPMRWCRGSRGAHGAGQRANRKALRLRSR